MPRKRIAGPSLAPAARQDIRDTLMWSEKKFGKTAAARYRTLIKQAVHDIGLDPERPGSKEQPEIMIPGARVYHLEYSSTLVPGVRVKEPRHFFLYRRSEDGIVEIARLLRDATDLIRHLPGGYRKPPA